MSADLQWMVLRNTSSFLVRKGQGIQGDFSSEPHNLTQQHSFKASGLANARTVGLAVVDKKIELSLKNGKKANKPASAYARSKLNTPARATQTLNKVTSGSFYRADLANAAVARYHALYKSLKPSAAKNQVLNRRKQAKK